MRTVSSNDDDTTWSLSACLECGLVRLTDVPPVELAYPSEYYGAGERKFVPGIEAVSHLRPALLSRAIRQAEATARREQRQPRFLDVGCGRGYLLKDLAGRGWKCAGIDIPGAPMPRNAADLGFDCRTGDACLLPWPADAFDLVVINHVLEHVHDPWRACREAHRVLRHNGTLYIGVPNYDSFQSRFFGQHWFPLEVPRHIYHFSRSSLARLLSDTGFRPTRWSTRSFRQGVFAWIQSVLNCVDRRPPNRLLAVIKGELPLSSCGSLVHVGLGAALAPVGFAEGCIASILGCGSVLIVLGVKSSSQTYGPVGENTATLSRSR